jgi:hypothetical protein
MLRGCPLASERGQGLRGEDGNRMPRINRALTTRRRRSVGNTALSRGRLRCSRAAGISSTAARVAACSAESRSVPVTATLNFGARPPGSTSARSFVLTTPRKRNSASAAPPRRRTPGLAPARLTSKAILRSRSRLAQPVSGGAPKARVPPSGARPRHRRRVLTACPGTSVRPRCEQIRAKTQVYCWRYSGDDRSAR